MRKNFWCESNVHIYRVFRLSISALFYIILFLNEWETSVYDFFYSHLHAFGKTHAYILYMNIYCMQKVFHIIINFFNSSNYFSRLKTRIASFCKIRIFFWQSNKKIEAFCGFFVLNGEIYVRTNLILIFRYCLSFFSVLNLIFQFWTYKSERSLKLLSNH